jgi:DnaJ-class molecular chaperone
LSPPTILSVVPWSISVVLVNSYTVEFKKVNKAYQRLTGESNSDDEVGDDDYDEDFESYEDFFEHLDDVFGDIFGDLLRGGGINFTMAGGQPEEYW